LTDKQIMTVADTASHTYTSHYAPLEKTESKILPQKVSTKK